MPFDLDSRDSKEDFQTHFPSTHSNSADRFAAENYQTNSLARKFFPDLMPEKDKKGDTLLMGSAIVTWQGRQMTLLSALDTLTVPTYSMRYETKGEFDLSKAMQNADYLELRAIMQKTIEIQTVRAGALKVVEIPHGLASK